MININEHITFVDGAWQAKIDGLYWQIFATRKEAFDALTHFIETTDKIKP